jgi:hypothetical protein
MEKGVKKFNGEFGAVFVGEFAQGCVGGRKGMLST